MIAAKTPCRTNKIAWCRYLRLFGLDSLYGCRWLSGNVVKGSPVKRAVEWKMNAGGCPKSLQERPFEIDVNFSCLH